MTSIRGKMELAKEKWPFINLLNLTEGEKSL